MKHIKRLSMKCQSIFLYALIFSLSAHLLILQKLETVYAISLALLLVCRVVFILCCFVDIMHDKASKQLKSDE